MLLGLFQVIYVVVMLLVIMVTHWGQKMLGLCGEGRCAVWKVEQDVHDCVVYVVFMVEWVVICCCCNCVDHGEIYGDF